MGNELEVKVKQQLGVINFNFEEIKDNLTGMMELYKGTQFTEDTSAAAKKEVATLKKIKKALNDRRIEVGKEYSKPYDDFVTKVKELTALIDEPIELIDVQVKVFEEKKKAEKKLKIQAAYDELIGEMGAYLPLDKIYDIKWENASTSMKSIKEDIEQVVSSTDMAVSTIKGMNSEVVPKALEQYRQNLSLSDAITYINKHEQMKADILAKEEKKRKEEEECKRIAEESRIKEEERKRVIEDERKRVSEENRIREEERKKLAEEERVKQEEKLKVEEKRKAEEKLRVLELIKVEQAAKAEPIKEELQVEINTYENPNEVLINEEPFSDIESMEDEFSEEPFGEEIEIDLPFVTVGEIKSSFTVVGTLEELEQVDMYLNSIGVFFERKDS